VSAAVVVQYEVVVVIMQRLINLRSDDMCCGNGDRPECNDFVSSAKKELHLVEAYRSPPISGYRPTCEFRVSTNVRLPACYLSTSSGITDFVVVVVVVVALQQQARELR
jgi:hypothetical protein